MKRPNGLKRLFTCHGVPDVGSNPAGDIYFRFSVIALHFKYGILDQIKCRQRRLRPMLYDINNHTFTPFSCSLF